MAENYEEIDLMEYLQVLWKWRLLIIFGTFACAVIAGVVSLSLPKSYEATEVIEIGKVREKHLAKTNEVKGIIESESFMSDVIHNLSLKESPKDLLEKIKVKGINGTSMFKLSAQGNSPKEAANIAKTIANLLIKKHKKKFDALMKLQSSYRESLRKDVREMEKEIYLRRTTLKNISENPGVNVPAVILLQQGLLEAENRLYTLKEKLQNLEVSLSPSNSYNTRVVAEPVTPEKPIKPKVKLNMLISVVLGLMVFTLLSFFLEYIHKYRERGETGAGKKS